MCIMSKPYVFNLNMTDKICYRNLVRGLAVSQTYGTFYHWFSRIPTCFYRFVNWRTVRDSYYGVLVTRGHHSGP